MENKKLFICLLVLVVLISGCNGNVKAPPSPPATPQEKWDEMQIKLTYVGNQEKTVPSVGISVKEFKLSKFQDQTKGFNYENDYQSLKTIQITEDEMKEVFSYLANIEFEKKNKNEIAVSLMLYNATSGTVKEELLDNGQAAMVAKAIRGYLTVSKGNADSLTIYG